MCGIFLYISHGNISVKQKPALERYFKKIKHRGPDQTNIEYHKHNVMIGFHRLAIVDPTPAGLQPFSTKRFICIINGEIYNHLKLKKYLHNINQVDVVWKSKSDCEVVVHLFNHLFDGSLESKDEEKGFESMILLCRDFLDGEFSVVIYDTLTDLVYYGTDEISSRPLFMGNGERGDFWLTSEQKALPKYVSIHRVPSCTVGYLSPPSRIRENKYIEQIFKINI